MEINMKRFHSSSRQRCVNPLKMNFYSRFYFFLEHTEGNPESVSFYRQAKSTACNYVTMTLKDCRVMSALQENQPNFMER